MTLTQEEKEKRRLRKLSREEKKKTWIVSDVEKITQKKNTKELKKDSIRVNLLLNLYLAHFLEQI